MDKILTLIAIQQVGKFELQLQTAKLVRKKLVGEVYANVASEEASPRFTSVLRLLDEMSLHYDQEAKVETRAAVADLVYLRLNKERSTEDGQ